MTSNKKSILQINITANWGSHGKIAEGIGLVAMQHGWDSHIAYGRWLNSSTSQLYRIGSNCDELVHVLSSRLFDNQGLSSKNATRRLLQYIDKLQPDIIHLHNIHGYYLHYPTLFQYLSASNIPTVWTLHDCWPFTGHCAHYMYTHCEKWKTHCKACPYIHTYPKSWFTDRSYQNFEDKKKTFHSVKNLTLVPVSHWLEHQLRQSFLKDKDIITIHNGIDLSTFKPQPVSSFLQDKYHIAYGQKIILGVASNWYHKGLNDFIQLRKLLDSSYTFLLIGLNKKEMRCLPKDIIGLQRTQNIEELTAFYSAANVFFNPTWEDNYPTTNLEAMACGTPVITYNTGGCSEAIDAQTGYVIPQGDIRQAAVLIQQLCGEGKELFAIRCRERAEQHFKRETCFQHYFDIYQKLLNI